MVVAAPGSEALARKQQTTYVGRQGTARMNGVRPGPVVVKFIPNGPWTAADQTVSLPSNGSDTVLNFEVKKRKGRSRESSPARTAPRS